MPDEKKTKQKIHMIAAILGTLKNAKGVKGSEEVGKLEATADEAKAALEAKDIEKAAQLGKDAGELLKACGKMLPKTPRKLIAPRIEQICRY